MYEIFVWVPTKGWKLVAKHSDNLSAYEHAREFEPLEVMVANPSGQHFFGGRGEKHFNIEEDGWTVRTLPELV